MQTEEKIEAGMKKARTCQKRERRIARLIAELLDAKTGIYLSPTATWALQSVLLEAVDDDFIPCRKPEEPKHVQVTYVHGDGRKSLFA